MSRANSPAQRSQDDEFIAQDLANDALTGPSITMEPSDVSATNAANSAETQTCEGAAGGGMREDETICRYCGSRSEFNIRAESSKCLIAEIAAAVAAPVAAAVASAYATRNRRGRPAARGRRRNRNAAAETGRYNMRPRVNDNDPPGETRGNRRLRSVPSTTNLHRPGRGRGRGRGRRPNVAGRYGNGARC